jgi:hypothetical protein
MMRFGTSVALSVVALLASGTAALAQDSGWAGYYVGAGLSDVGGRNGQVEATIDPGLDPRLIYDTNPIGRSFSRERNIDRESTYHLQGGRLFETRGWVWGVEGHFRAEGPDRTVGIGPLFAPDVRGRARANSPTGGIPIGGGLILTRDELIGSIDLGAEASIRARAGRQLGERFLVSAFVGPSVLQADLGLRQESLVLSNLVYANPTGGILLGQTQGTFSVSNEVSDNLFGAVVGASVDAKITDRWLITGQITVAMYDDIEVVGAAYAGTGSRFSYEPTLYSASISLIRRF